MKIEDALKSFPARSPGAHKGDLGHVLVLAGSIGYTGAAYLASQASAVSGSGLVTLAIGKSLYPIMAVKLTEVMVRPFPETKDLSLGASSEKAILRFAQNCDALAIGPGISRNADTQRLVRSLMKNLDKPVVLDADGITACAGHLDSIKRSKSKLVLTPHSGEMGRLLGIEASEVEKARKDVALDFAAEYNTVLVLKGRNTIVAGPDGDLYINETGNAGMATGGTGDVLTGLIAGLIAQGCPTFTASVLGVYLHGVAGDMAAKEKGTLGMLATDLLDSLPGALKILRRQY